MSNGARHTWGFFVGLVLTAALVALLIFGTYRLQHGYVAQLRAQDKWIGAGLITGAAIVFGLLVASRLSPVASLVGGVVLTAFGVLFFVSQKTTADLINRFPLKGQRISLAALEEDGLMLFAGVSLLLASVFPSRWKSREDSDAGYEYEPLRSSYSSGRSTGEHRTARHAYGSTDRTSLDVPIYEQETHGGRTETFGGHSEAFGGRPETPGRRSPYGDPDESGGGTWEMRRPD